MGLSYPPVRTLALVLIAACAAGAAGCGADEEGGGDGGLPPRATPFDADRALADLEAQVEIGPRPSGSSASRETARLIADRLREAGVLEVQIQRPYANVVGWIQGSEPGAVVVGAHYDTKDAIPGFVGANDGASGVAVVLELARALPLQVDGPDIRLALFDAEEPRGNRPFDLDGARGSRQYVELARRGGGQGSAPRADIRAMVLFDLVGDCELEIPLEANSDPALYALFAAAAEERTGSPEPFEGRTSAVGDDHLPFVEAGIPALDLIDFDFGPGPSPGAWWHTDRDTLDKVCAESLDAVGEAALRAIPEIR
jgi:glutaminyl-peptide cyclotransferase